MKLSTMDEVSEKRRTQKVEWFRVIRDQDLDCLKKLLSEGFCPDTLDEVLDKLFSSLFIVK